MGLYDIARSVFAGWINDPARAHWGRYIDVMALTVDVLVELVDEVVTASRPGQVELDGVPNLGGYWSVDALKFIGEDRLVFRGLAETSGHYAERLRKYRDNWRLAGTVVGLLDELAGALTWSGGGPPLLRMVSSAGVWWTREPDGTYRMQTTTGKGFSLDPDGTCAPDTTTAHAWDWDSASDPAPPDQGDGTRGTLLVYAPAAYPYLTDDDDTCADPGVVGDGWNDPVGGYEGSPWAGTVGTNAPISLVENVRAVVQQRRAAGYLIPWIAICFDPNSFKPNGTSTGTNAYPDGHWGYSSKYDSGTNTMVPSRLATAEYWPSEPGGIAK